MTRTVLLGDICTKVTSGGTPSTKHDEYYNGNIPWLRTQEVNFGNIYSTEKAITEAGLKNSSAKIIPENSVIIAMYGATAGKSAINKIPLTTNQACCNLIIDHKKADYRYVYYYLLNIYEKLLGAATGAAQQNLGSKQIAAMPIILPSLEEQKKIADILRTIDEKIELNRKMNETLEQMGQALFRHYFIDNPEAKRWEEGKLGELTDINKESIGKEYPYEEIRYVDISSVSTGSIDKYETTELNSAPSRAKRIVRDGDIIWAMVRPNRRAYSLVMNPDENTIVSTGFAVLSPKKNALGFVYYLTSSRSFSDYLTLHARGAAYPAVTATDFKNAPVTQPDEKTLERFNELVIPNLRLMSELKQQIQTLTTLRDTLLPRLISGKVKLT